jgi:hypothetical protein
MTHADPRAPRVATIHDMAKKPGRVLPRSSAIFHAYDSMDTIPLYNREARLDIVQLVDT